MNLYLSSSSSSSVARPLFGGRIRGLRLPGRTKSLGAERRPSECNIIGHEAIVSKKYTLDKIQQAQANTHITKLELEDVVNRENGVFAAIRNLLARDGKREWQYIKFIDSIQVHNGPGMDAVSQWQAYSNKRQELWNQVGLHAKNKPIMFQVKLEVTMGTSIREVQKMLKVLQDLQVLTRIEFGGALYACHKPEVPNKLSDLFIGDEEDGIIGRGSLYLEDMIMLNLFCTVPDAAPVNNSASVLIGCRKALRALTRSDNEESTEMDGSSARTEKTNRKSKKSNAPLVPEDETDATTQAAKAASQKSSHIRRNRSHDEESTNSAAKTLTRRTASRTKSHDEENTNPAAKTLTRRTIRGTNSHDDENTDSAMKTITRRTIHRTKSHDEENADSATKTLTRRAIRTTKSSNSGMKTLTRRTIHRSKTQPRQNSSSGSGALDVEDDSNEDDSDEDDSNEIALTLSQSKSNNSPDLIASLSVLDLEMANDESERRHCADGSNHHSGSNKDHSSSGLSSSSRRSGKRGSRRLGGSSSNRSLRRCKSQVEKPDFRWDKQIQPATTSPTVVKANLCAAITA